jgi:hypothetical protein
VVKALLLLHKLEKLSEPVVGTVEVTLGLGTAEAICEAVLAGVHLTFAWVALRSRIV